MPTFSPLYKKKKSSCQKPNKAQTLQSTRNLVPFPNSQTSPNPSLSSLHSPPRPSPPPRIPKMSFLLLSRRHVKPHLIRHFCTTTTTTTTAAAAATKPKTPKPTPSSAVTRLLREFDPDRALTILSSSPSSSSSRYALSLAARRLARSRRSADATSLLLSDLQNTSPLSDSHLSFILSSFSFAYLSPDSALSAFLSHAPQIPGRPTSHSFNALLCSFLHHRHLHRRVPDLFSQLSRDFNINPDVASYCILVKAHCISGDVSKAFEVLSEMREKGVEPTVAIYTSIVDSLYKQGRVEEAEKTWEEMMASGCMPDSQAYNVRVMHFAKKGKLEEMDAVMKEMEEKGVKKDTVTWNFLMMGYFKSRMVEEAVRVYKGLVSGEKGCKANAATYKNALVLLCEAGEFGKGFGVFRDSVKRNKVPDFMAVKGLVEGLVREGEVEKAKRVVDEVKQKFPEKQLGGWRRVEKELGLSTDGVEMSASANAAEVEDV